MKNNGAERKRVPFAFIVVGSVFSIIALVLLAIAIWTLQHQFKASTPLMALVAFGWAFLAMVVSMILSLPGARQRDGRTRVRAGTVTLADPSPLPGQTRSTLTGPGVEATGSATITVGSRVPSIWLGIASLGLVVVSVLLYLHGRTTGIGIFIGLIMSFFIMSWATKAWPRERVAEAE
ncbi:hypothetical protein [Paraburkholderia sp.]|uniref:hypothetical protein n=1 Tax=Paraburkholderia sp. TaxID=1926495 RepID=UPI003D6E036D